MSIGEVFSRGDLQSPADQKERHSMECFDPWHFKGIESWPMANTAPKHPLPKQLAWAHEGRAVWNMAPHATRHIERDRGDGSSARKYGQMFFLFWPIPLGSSLQIPSLIERIEFTSV